MNIRALLFGAGLSIAAVAGLNARAPQGCPFGASKPAKALPPDGLEAERTKWNTEARFPTAELAMSSFSVLNAELRGTFGTPEAHVGTESAAWISSPARQVEFRYRSSDRLIVVTLTNLGGTYLVHRQVRYDTAKTQMAARQVQP
jgi:hypothetical protein